MSENEQGNPSEVFQMRYRQFERQTRGAIHRRVTLKLEDGSVVEGYLQPFTETTAYLTPLTQTGEALRVEIAQVVDILIHPLD